ncbi:MAG: PLP-dependent aminotransferase family protein [Allorhizobium sp.]
MTNWLKDRSAGKGPLYIRLADDIEGSISDGSLAAGAKLPPQRNLAYDLGVTIGTISRAYGLVHQRGLVSGEVGRGTFVLDRRRTSANRGFDPVSAALSGTRPEVTTDDMIRFDSTAATDIGQAAIIERHIVEIIRDHPSDITSYARQFPKHWFSAGAQWLGTDTWQPQPDDIVPTLGAHAGVMAVIVALTAPGDRIVFEHITYSQISRSAGLAGRRTILVNSDDEGIIPEDFERLCAQQHPKIAFVMTSSQNPTLATLPESRRRAIADIARQHNVWLIEDNLYGALSRHSIPLLAEIAPDRTFLVGGLSKSVAAGVRGGWVACPPHYAQRVRIAHKMMTGGLPFLLAELCARLVESGDAGRIRGQCSEEMNARHGLARDAFSGYDFISQPGVPFLWLKLPEPWLSGTFKNAAMNNGVLVDDEDEFKAGRSEKTVHRVRVGFSAPQSRDEVARGLAILRRLLDGGATGYDSIA